MPERFSFESVDALDYDELRPEYAPEAVTWVADRCDLRPGSHVVDLVAGTGRLSGRFVELNMDVVAVEPAANMRAVLEQRFPTVRAIVATAESMSFDDGSVDAVVVGNAFHHFDHETAMAEIHRVLRPGGGLALFWAWPDEEEQVKIPGMGAIYNLVEPARTESAIAAAHRSWAEPPAAAEGFGPFERRSFPATHVVPAARLADLMRRPVTSCRSQLGRATRCWNASESSQVRSRRRCISGSAPSWTCASATSSRRLSARCRPSVRSG